MSSFSYTSSIPATNNDPADDQPLMQTNFSSISSLLAVDHVGFNTANGGMHNQITFPANNVPSVPTSPPVLFRNIQDGAGNNLPGSVPQLFFYSGTSGQGQNNYIAQSNGSTMLMGGIILKWGSSSWPGQSGYVNFASAFPNNCFAVICQNANSGNNTTNINVIGTATNRFQVFSPNNSGGSNLFYIAIGN